MTNRRLTSADLPKNSHASPRRRTATLSLMWRMLRRDWRAGELTVLGIALVLAVASLTGVGFLADRVEGALQQESHQLLGGDLLLTADHPWPEAIVSEAQSRGLQLASSVSFPSMVGNTKGDVVLADIKAVSPNYPLRGVLRIAPALNQPDAPTRRTPSRGEAWPDERLASGLGLTPEAALTVGLLNARSAQVLTREPDRGMNVMALAPRLMIALDDLPASGLVQPGSRINYRVHIAGDKNTVSEFATWAKEHLARGERLEGVDNARPEVRSVLDRAQRFLRLAALLSVVMAAVAVAMSAERFLRRHLDACAVMRTLGALERQIVLIHGGEFVLFGLFAIVIGSVLGYGVQALLLDILGSLLFAELPAPSLMPWLHGVAVGLVLLGGFALPPLLRLRRVPTMRVLRREFEGEQGSALPGYALGTVLLGALLLWIAGDLTLGAFVLGGFACAIVVYALAARALLSLLSYARPAGRGYGWRHGVVNVLRHRRASLVQLVALGLGLTSLLLLTVARDDLLGAWQKKTPADAPNRFIINIQPEQVAAVSAFFMAEGIGQARIEPMIRGRLLAVNGKNVAPADFANERAQRLVDREFNLSWTDELPSGNQVTAGAWHGRNPIATANANAPISAQTQFSVEQGLAETLSLGLGDTLEYQVAGQRMSGTVTSLRKLEWDSMRVNFFVIASPGVLESFPASFITSVHIPSGKEAAIGRLLRAFPNLTVIDTVSLIRQVQDTLDQVVRAMQLIFGFSLLTGVVVLLATLQAGADERRHELAVLRALGARSRQLVHAMLAEYAILGTLAGLLAGIGATGIAWALARFVFQLAYWPTPAVALIGMACGLTLITFAGALGLRSVLNQPALASLRGA
jgi:putative ABC transport system permease protein